jgi:ribosomal RNA-processing protein 7
LSLKKDKNEDETFFFVREHRGKDSSSDTVTNTAKSGTGSTLFVANAPVVPAISTKVLLKSIFGRFADVLRVTVVQNPRAAAATVEEGEQSSLSTINSSSAFFWSENNDYFHPTFLPPILSSNEGKYAHVVFASTKEMKKAKKALEDLMSDRRHRKSSKKTKKDDHEEENILPALELDRIEIQTLSDESLRQWEEHREKVLLGNNEDDDPDRDHDYEKSSFRSSESAQTGVLAVASRYRESCKLLSRSRLLEECNTVMQNYEEAEEAKRRAQEIAKSQPDEDGFVTVSYSSAVGSKVDLEESITATTPGRRKGNKRSRKKKEAIGSQELKDFYRFQRRENRKRTMEDLRKQFDEDLKRVKRLKEEKQYRPF